VRHCRLYIEISGSPEFTFSEDERIASQSLEVRSCASSNTNDFLWPAPWIVSFYGSAFIKKSLNSNSLCTL
jgi:hypothetical protein